MVVMIGFIISVLDFKDLTSRQLNLSTGVENVNKNKIVKLFKSELNKCFLSLIKI